MSLAVTGLGLVTSAGLNAAESHAAFLAASSAFRELGGTDRWGGKRLAAVLPALGTRKGRDRLPVFAAIAASESLRRCSQQPELRLGVHLCLPDSERPAPSVSPRDLHECLRDVSLRGWPIGELLEWPRGSAGLAAILAHADAALRAGRIDVALVGGCDSLLDARTLRWLEDVDGLKGEQNPDGTIPGEGAAFLCLEDPGRAHARRARVYANVSGWGEGSEPGFVRSGKPCLATGLSSAVRAALRSAPGARPVTLLSDLNGDSYRAKELAYTEVRTLGETPREHQHPADCFGDLGCVTGVALSALGALAISQADLDAPLLVTLGSDGADRAALLLTPGTNDPHARRVTGEMLDLGALAPKLVSAERTRESLLARASDAEAEHRDEASFFFGARERAASSFRHDLASLARLDRRLLGHLDGVCATRLAGASGAQLAEPGLVFAETVAAARRGEVSRVLEVAELAKSPEERRALASAFAWLHPGEAAPLLERLARDVRPTLRELALEASPGFGAEVTGVLEGELRADDPSLRAAALRACGLLGRTEQLGAVRESLTHSDPRIARAASHAAVLLGDSDAARALLEPEVLDADGAEAAVRLAVKALRGHGADEAVAALLGDAARKRLAIRAIASHGDPAHVPWLFEAMADESLARVAFEALGEIAGSEVFRAASREAPPADDDAAGDEADRDLPWPDVSRAHEWWSARARGFRAGRSYLAGGASDANAALELIRSARQPLRAAAALELALQRPGAPLFDVTAPASLQRVRLAS